MLRAHTFLSRFERVSFNFALISICCFWDGSAARSTRRNKPSARASSQKDPFQLGPFILFFPPPMHTPVSITAREGVKDRRESKELDLLSQTLQPLRILPGEEFYGASGGDVGQCRRAATVKETLSAAVGDGLLCANRLARRAAGAALGALTAGPTLPTAKYLHSLLK